MALILLNVAPFFCLCASRIIIASVAKQKFHTFDDFHLSIPVLISIAIFPINKMAGLGLSEDIVEKYNTHYKKFNRGNYIFEDSPFKLVELKDLCDQEMMPRID